MFTVRAQSSECLPTRNHTIIAPRPSHIRAPRATIHELCSADELSEIVFYVFGYSFVESISEHNHIARKCFYPPAPAPKIIFFITNPSRNDGDIYKSAFSELFICWRSWKEWKIHQNHDLEQMNRSSMHAKHIFQQNKSETSNCFAFLFRPQLNNGPRSKRYIPTI